MTDAHVFETPIMVQVGSVPSHVSSRPSDHLVELVQPLAFRTAVTLLCPIPASAPRRTVPTPISLNRAAHLRPRMSRRGSSLSLLLIETTIVVPTQIIGIRVAVTEAVDAGMGLPGPPDGGRGGRHAALLLLLAGVPFLPPDADCDDDGEADQEDDDHDDPARVLVPPVLIS